MNQSVSLSHRLPHQFRRNDSFVIRAVQRTLTAKMLFRRSRSFKVTDFCTNRKLTYGFLYQAWQVLCIKSWIYESARNLCLGRRAVPLQTFTTTHSNRTLSIVKALSATFTQYAPETTIFSKITQNKGHFAVQGHSRSLILVPIESS